MPNENRNYQDKQYCPEECAQGTRQEIMTAGSMHKTNKAALRYIQAEKNKSIAVYRKVREMQGKVVHIGKRKAE